MAQFTFEIPDQEAERIAMAVCQANGHAPVSLDDAQQFTQQWVFRMLARIVVDQEANAAADEARGFVYANPNDPLAQALLTDD